MKHRLGATEAWRRARLLVVLLCTMLSAASGHEFEAGGIVYRTTGDGAGRCEVARYDDTVWDVVEVPDSVADDRGTWEYLYDIHALATLAGNKYMKKRNRLGNYFHTIAGMDNMFFVPHRMKQPSGTYLAADTAASASTRKGQACWAFSPSYPMDGTQAVGLYLAHEEQANVGAADGHVTTMNKVELNRCPFNFRYMLSQGLVPVTISDDVD